MQEVLGREFRIGAAQAARRDMTLEIGGEPRDALRRSRRPFRLTGKGTSTTCCLPELMTPVVTMVTRSAAP